MVLQVLLNVRTESALIFLLEVLIRFAQLIYLIVYLTEQAVNYLEHAIVMLLSVQHLKTSLHFVIQKLQQEMVNVHTSLELLNAHKPKINAPHIM